MQSRWPGDQTFLILKYINLKTRTGGSSTFSCIYRKKKNNPIYLTWNLFEHGINALSI